MKWPEYLLLIRHDVSKFNILKEEKNADPEYKEFCREYKNNPESANTVAWAKIIAERYALGMSDSQTSLVDIESSRAKIVGKKLKQEFGKPDVIFYSPYLRARQTLDGIISGWPELARVKTYEEERIREQERGLALFYSDWRVFHVLHPEQRQLYDLLGPYWYQYPQGENIPMVRDRNRSWVSALIRDFHDRKVLAITHHLNILALRANLERLSEKKFIRLDEKGKPINCGVTCYEGVPKEGENGRLKLKFYNRQYY